MQRSNIYPTLIRSQYGPEQGQYLTDFDEFGVVEKPWVSAFQRHQNHENPLGNRYWPLSGQYYDLVKV